MQSIIVGIIVLGCIGFVVRRIIQYFRRISYKVNPCEGCCGCDMMKKKQENCTKKQTKVWKFKK